MSKTRRHFDASFKLEVICTIKEQGLSIAQVCKDRQLEETAVRHWVLQVGAEQTGGAEIGKPLTAEQQRIRQLETENRLLRQDVDILKKHRPSLPEN